MLNGVGTGWKQVRNRRKNRRKTEGKQKKNITLKRGVM
jgi:hypothetical protein